MVHEKPPAMNADDLTSKGMSTICHSSHCFEDTYDRFDEKLIRIIKLYSVEANMYALFFSNEYI